MVSRLVRCIGRLDLARLDVLRWKETLKSDRSAMVRKDADGNPSGAKPGDLEEDILFNNLHSRKM